MKLQVNNSGAWKQIADLPADAVEQVKRAAQRIGQAAALVNGRVVFRLVDDDGEVALYWDIQRGWYLPARLRHDGR